MFFVPTWISNFIFLGTCWLSGYQLVQLRRANPVTSIPFVMILFCMAMVVVVARMNKDSPWLSLAFFLVAVSCLIWMIRRLRLLPPRKPIR
jgi:hypothetical protein